MPFFRFYDSNVIGDYVITSMEELLVTKFEEVKKILAIIKPLPQIGYSVNYGALIDRDELRNTYR